MSRNLFTTLVVLLLATAAAIPNALAQETKPMTDAAREQFLKEFHRTALNTTPGDAMTLRILVQTSRAKRGVEVGTATGFGALHMGIAFERNGGHLDTVDIDPQMVKNARANLAKAGLEKTVTVIEGDALKVLPKLEGEYDFVFLDALKRDYLKYFQALSPRLKKGAVVVADNVVQSAGEMRDFLEFMKQNPDYEMTTIRASEEKGDGMAIFLKVR